MNKNLSKSSVMLLEIMISICFFAAMVAICLTLLFHALKISEKTTSLTHGIYILNSMASTFDGTQTNTIYQYYDNEYKQTDKSSAKYVATLTPSENVAYLSFATKDKELIYEETIRVHIPCNIAQEVLP